MIFMPLSRLCSGLKSSLTLKTRWTQWKQAPPFGVALNVRPPPVLLFGRAAYLAYLPN